MPSRTLTFKELWSDTFAIVRQKGMVLLAWGIVVLLLCMPLAAFFGHNIVVNPDVSQSPSAIWYSLPIVTKIAGIISVWLMTLGALGLTQAGATLAAWDASQLQPTSLGSLFRRLLPMLPRILGLEAVVFLTVYIFLLIVIFLPLSVFAIPAFLIDGCDVSKGIALSASIAFRNAGKVLVIFLVALAVTLGWMHALGPALSNPGSFLAALNLEAHIAVFYLAGIIIGIPTTLIYCQHR